MINLYADTAAAATTNTAATGFDIGKMILSALTTAAGSGWVGIAAMGLMSLLAVVGAVAGSWYLAKYIKNKTYTNDLDTSNSSAGKEAVDAAKADQAAKEQLQDAMPGIHNELDQMAKPKPTKK